MWKQWKQWQTLFLGAPKSLQMVTSTMKLKDVCSLEENLWPTLRAYKKQRHYIANKDSSSQGFGFSSNHVWMWEMDYKESWALENWYFEPWCWRRLLRVPLTPRRSNQSILKKISPEYSLQGLTLKVKLQYFGHLMRRTNSLEKTVMLGNIVGRRRRGWRRMRLLDGITDSIGMREEGGGFRMGNTCILVVDSFWYLANLIQLCKV